jgi:hypothetical protein
MIDLYNKKYLSKNVINQNSKSTSNDAHPPMRLLS